VVIGFPFDRDEARWILVPDGADCQCILEATGATRTFILSVAERLPFAKYLDLPVNLLCQKSLTWQNRKP
jgi:hypothetical protein